MVHVVRLRSALLLGSLVIWTAGLVSAQEAGSARAEPPAPASPAPAGSEAKPADAPQSPSVTGGYSWTDQVRQRRPRRAAKRLEIKYDPAAAHATFPGFRVLPDGSSLIWLVLDRRVAVEVRRAKGQVTYVLKGAQVNSRNNTHPLVTTHFRTPLARLRLLPQAGGAHLVLELREAVDPVHQVMDGPRGMMVLRVKLPRSARAWGEASSESLVQVGGALPSPSVGAGRRTPAQP